MCVRACMYVYVLRIVYETMDKILHFTNTLIILFLINH